MKQLLLILFAVCLILTMTACAEKETVPTTTAPQTTPPTTGSVPEDPTTAPTEPTGSAVELPREEWPEPPLVTTPDVSVPGITQPPERPPDIPPPQQPPIGPSQPSKEDR